MFGGRLGFGFMRLPYKFNEVTCEEEVDTDLVCKMVDEYIGKGYKYFETAKPYMWEKSEQVIKTCVADRYSRDRFLLADKLPFNLKAEEDLDKLFSGQLESCGVEYFDFYLLHNLNRRVFESYEKIGGFEFLNKVKNAGKARYVGFSFHGTPDLLEELLQKYPWVDFVQLQINYWDWESPHIQSRKCYEIARKHNKKIFVMEPVKGGKLADIPEEGLALLRAIRADITPVELALRYVNSLEGVELILSGMSSLKQVEENTALFKNTERLSEELLAATKKIAEMLDKKYEIACTSCEYCMEKCPAKISIPKFFSVYNSYRMAGSDDKTALSRHQLLIKAIEGGKISECYNCGLCESICPQHLHIRECLRKVNKCFEWNENIYTAIKSVQIIIALLKKFEIRNLVLSPGTRNIPFVHSVERDPYFRCYSVVDERSAAYFAMGMAQALGEPVVISCTSSSACCNYLSAITEAYYQGIPLVVLTGDRDPRREGQMEDQMIHQEGMYHDVCKKSVELPDVQSDEDFWYCERLVNEALLELNHHGTGPVHINVPVFKDLTRYTSRLPEVRAIKRHMACDMADLSKDKVQELLAASKVMVLYGQSRGADGKEAALLESFAKKYNAVIIAEHMANLDCKYVLNPFLLLDAAAPQGFPEELLPDIVITVGGRIASKVKGLLREHFDKFTHWDINDDGNVVDVFKCLTDIFECSSYQFFETFSNTEGKEELSYYHLWKKYVDSIRLPEIPYSNVIVIKKMLEEIPEGSILHLSVLNSIRISQFFALKRDIKVYANIGADGIDGAMSTFLGQAVVTNKLSFLIVGDLSFFYDMNSAWMRYIRSNVRILMVNNGGGGEFHFTFGNIIPDTIDDFVAASHNSSAKAWIESQGFEYMSAKNEAELEKQLPQFVSADSDKPIFFEVFTNRSIDGATIRKVFAKNREEVLAVQKPADYKVHSEDRGINTNYPKYPFPYDKVIGLGKRIVIYGAGNVGKIYYRQVSENENCQMIAWVDKNAEKMASSGIPAENPAVLKDREFDALVIAIKDSEVVKQVKATLLSEGIPESKIVWSIVEL